MPIVTVQDGRRRADCCPLNFKTLSSLPGDAVISIERLNQMLVAVNSVFRSANSANRALPERLTMVQALRITKI